MTSPCVHKLSSNIAQVSLLLDLSEFSWLSALVPYFLLYNMSSSFYLGLLSLHKMKRNLRNA